jgi:hypothetical protein
LEWRATCDGRRDRVSQRGWGIELHADLRAHGLNRDVDSEVDGDCRRALWRQSPLAIVDHRRRHTRCVLGANVALEAPSALAVAFCWSSVEFALGLKLTRHGIIAD